jgi:uncharacterized protein YycO
MKGVVKFIIPFIVACIGILGVVSWIQATPNYRKHHFSVKPKPEVSLQDGDIIFQSSTSGQSLAVQLATKSKYSHCGLIYKKGNETYVLEAVQPVKITPLAEWIKHGDGNHYLVKRLKNDETILTEAVSKRMQQEEDKLLNKDYDLLFDWSDDKIYCSELVWKVYKRGANVEVGKLQKLKEFDLSNPIVKQKLKERYGNHIPLEETVISPGNIFASELLERVVEK